jgi:thioredoxin-related protein
VRSERGEIMEFHQVQVASMQRQTFLLVFSTQNCHFFDHLIKFYHSVKRNATCQHFTQFIGLLGQHWLRGCLAV